MSIKNKSRAIEELNRQLKTCTDCQLFRTRKNVLCGEGDVDSQLMLVALSPGQEEDKYDKMFIGPSGRILDNLLKAAQVRRDRVYMTNLIKCMLPKNRRPKMDEIESCTHFLEREISIIQPRVIVPLGYYATRTILEKYKTEPPAARKDYPSLYGQLVLSNNQKIFPLPHPASMLYHPEFESEAIEMYKKLSILLHECKWFSCCPMKRFYEQGRLDRKWIELYCKGLWKNCIRYQKEENGDYHPDWMLPDGTLDEQLKSR